MFTESKHAKMLRKVVLKSDRVIDGAWDDRTRRSLSLFVTRPSTLLGATFHRTGEKFSPLIKRPLNKVARKKLPRPLISE